MVVIRFSAMGDVAMTVPVVRQLLDQHPQLHVTMVSNASFAPLFAGHDRLQFVAAHLKGKHAGWRGMYRLFRELRSTGKIDRVADLHGVLRAKLLRIFFILSGTKVCSIDKGRKEKKLLTAHLNKQLVPLKQSTERYAAVFQQLGFPVSLSPSYRLQSSPMPSAFSLHNKESICIGIAPFAKHPLKMYPLEHTKTLVDELSHLPINIYLFGAGHAESEILQTWTNGRNVINLTNAFQLSEELSIISNLQLMISMDSANMHLASLYGVPVVSVWGPTHPFAGFNGYGQSLDNTIGLNIPCRPCSVYGNKPCFRKDHACMQQLPYSLIYQKVTNLLHLS